jgi:hypothetical protein
MQHRISGNTVSRRRADDGVTTYAPSVRTEIKEPTRPAIGLATRGHLPAAFYAEIVTQLSAQETPSGTALPRKHPRPSTPLGDAVEQGVRA